jgi:type 2 lantibiotic biosynthesis protein LanM
MTIHTEQQHLTAQAIINQPAWYKALSIAERLASLRIQSRDHHLSESYDAEKAISKLQRWKEQKPFEITAAFVELLASRGLTEAEFLILLGEPVEAVQARTRETPDWLRAFAHALTTPVPPETAPLMARFKATLETSGSINNEVRTAFLLVPFLPLIAQKVTLLQIGITALSEQQTHLPFDPETIPLMLCAQLPNLLLPQMSRVLTLELHVARLQGRLVGQTPQARFQCFVEQLCQPEQLIALLEEYPVLVRTVMTTLAHWVDTSVEVLQRLCADWHEICLTLFQGDDPGKLIAIDAGVGDLHQGGHSTLKLAFDSGAYLVYKPRSLSVDVHFQHLLDWLNARGDHPSFRTLKLIDRETYGWSEFVAPQSCESREEVARFYERQGGYLALLYALEATDFHYENVIAAGEHPVLIDLEALFQPRTARSALPPSLLIAEETLHHSVLHVGLLPQRVRFQREQTGVDISGLGGEGGQLTPLPVPQLAEVGTDQMHVTRQQVPIAERENRPRLKGDTVELLDYSEPLCAGFTKIYRVLMQHREELLAGPLLAFAQDKIRVIMRPTTIYARFLYESAHPDLLRDGLDRERFFDRLWISTEHSPQLRRVIAAEQADLQAGDIPLFTSCPETRDLYTSGGECLAEVFDEPSWETVKRRLFQFDERDLARQIWFVQASLTATRLEQGHFAHGAVRLQPTPLRASRKRLLRAACEVGDRLCEQALVGSCGASWIGLTYLNEQEWELMPAGIDLYAGASGIALFLAYLGAITGEEKYTRLARAALKAIRQQVEEFKQHPLSIGAYEGWGAVLYLYTHLGALWHDPACLDEAQAILEWLPDLIETDQSLDMIGGTAGCLASVLSLYRTWPSKQALTVARQCGDRLLSYAAQCSKAPLSAMRAGAAGPMTAIQPLAGFSHGAAGIALSLLNLADASGEERFRQGAQRAMAYERSVFSPKAGNWPDFRLLKGDGTTRSNETRHESQFMVSWCHGAPGIVLGRLASLPYLDEPVMREEIEVGLRTTLEQGFYTNHSLCHGMLGNLEAVHLAGHVLDDEHYREQTERLAAMILASIAKHDWVTGIPMGIETPGLMTGIAGIGYELLRLAEPQKVPSVLCLAAPVQF